MRRLDAYKVDAFTTTPYTGNIAGVVTDAAGLSERDMQAIAREMNVSETAFVLPADAPGAQLRLRFFTPTSEIRLCGHATVAAFHVLVERGELKAPARVPVQTNVGVLQVEVREGNEVYLTSDPLRFADAPVDLATCASLLGLPRAELGEPAMLVQDILLVPVSGLRAMAAVRPDLPAIRALHPQVDGIVPVSLETTTGALTRIRYFLPGSGIDEDPVTGVAHMALAGWLLRTGRLRAPARFAGEQGFECGRPGRVLVEVDGTAEAPTVRAGGRAVTTLVGSIARP